VARANGFGKLAAVLSAGRNIPRLVPRHPSRKGRGRRSAGQLEPSPEAISEQDLIGGAGCRRR